MHGWDMGGLRELAIGEGREGWGGERDGRKEREVHLMKAIQPRRERESEMIDPAWAGEGGRHVAQRTNKVPQALVPFPLLVPLVAGDSQAHGKQDLPDDGGLLGKGWQGVGPAAPGVSHNVRGDIPAVREICIPENGEISLLVS